MRRIFQLVVIVTVIICTTADDNRKEDENVHEKRSIGLIGPILSGLTSLGAMAGGSIGNDYSGGTGGSNSNNGAGLLSLIGTMLNNGMGVSFSPEGISMGTKNAKPITDNFGASTSNNFDRSQQRGGDGGSGTVGGLSGPGIGFNFDLTKIGSNLADGYRMGKAAGTTGGTLLGSLFGIGGGGGGSLFGPPNPLPPGPPPSLNNPMGQYPPPPPPQQRPFPPPPPPPPQQRQQENNQFPHHPPSPPFHQRQEQFRPPHSHQQPLRDSSFPSNHGSQQSIEEISDKQPTGRHNFQEDLDHREPTVKSTRRPKKNKSKGRESKHNSELESQESSSPRTSTKKSTNRHSPSSSNKNKDQEQQHGQRDQIIAEMVPSTFPHPVFTGVDSIAVPINTAFTVTDEMHGKPDKVLDVPVHPAPQLQERPRDFISNDQLHFNNNNNNVNNNHNFNKNINNDNRFHENAFQFNNGGGIGDVRVINPGDTQMFTFDLAPAPHLSAVDSTYAGQVPVGLLENNQFGGFGDNVQREFHDSTVNGQSVPFHNSINGNINNNQNNNNMNNHNFR